jgi:Domain of unknown function (DUF5658)
LLTQSKWIPLAVLGLLQAADGLSTRAALAIPGSVELNPLVRSLGLWPGKLLVLALVLTLAYITTRPRRLWALCGVYGLILTSNSLLVWLHR